MENVKTVDELMEKLNSLADEMSGKKRTPSTAELRKAENYRRRQKTTGELSGNICIPAFRRTT